MSGFDPVRLHAVLDVLGFTVSYTGAGFHPDTPWANRVVLRCVTAYGEMIEPTNHIPGRAGAPKSAKQRTIEAASFTALAQALADHPNPPISDTVENVREAIAAAVEIVDEKGGR